MEYTSGAMLMAVGAVVLLYLLLSEVWDWLLDFMYYYCGDSYITVGGPGTWMDICPEKSLGYRQSPINLNSDYAIVCPAETVPPLKFSAEYSLTPTNLSMFSDGHCVVLFGCWPDTARPKVCGGPLEGFYTFVNARIRCGPNDEEGSEHTIDSHKFAMEIQATHIKEDNYYFNLENAAENNAVLIISYIFQLVSEDNPNLQPLTSSLKKIKRSGTGYVDLEPSPLSCLLPPFCSQYFTYRGSFTTPPWTESVQWMIKREPLGISSKQLREFRRISYPATLKPIPVQNLRGRQICLYD